MPGSLLPEYEQPFWSQGKLVAGVDEVGRGALAGPVVAAAVILPRGFQPGLPIRDSKQLTPAQRSRIAHYIRSCALAYAVGWVEPELIDTFNILRATLLAMAQAVNALPIQPDYVLVDGTALPDIPIPARAIAQGDRRCLSIAAAAILAKVARDEWMSQVAALRYPEYGFAQHKGYGTPQHWEALRQYGPCALHRRSFLKQLRPQTVQHEPPL
jgi:ribonuclease HII